MRNLWCGMLAMTLVACGGADASVGSDLVSAGEHSSNRFDEDAAADAAPPTPMETPDAADVDAGPSCPYKTLHGLPTGFCGPVAIGKSKALQGCPDVQGFVYACESGGSPGEGCTRIDDANVICNAESAFPVSDARDCSDAAYPFEFAVSTMSTGDPSGYTCETSSKSWSIGGQMGPILCCSNT